MNINIVGEIFDKLKLFSIGEFMDTNIKKYKIPVTSENMHLGFIEIKCSEIDLNRLKYYMESLTDDEIRVAQESDGELGNMHLLLTWLSENNIAYKVKTASTTFKFNIFPKELGLGAYVMHKVWVAKNIILTTWGLKSSYFRLIKIKVKTLLYKLGVR